MLRSLFLRKSFASKYPATLRRFLSTLPPGQAGQDTLSPLLSTKTGCQSCENKTYIFISYALCYLDSRSGGSGPGTENKGSDSKGWNWQALADGVRLGFKFVVPLTLFYVGSRYMTMDQEDDEEMDSLSLFSAPTKGKSKNKSKYQLKVVPFEGTISTYHNALLEAREVPIDKSDASSIRAKKKALKLRKMREQMSAHTVWFSEYNSC